MPYKVFKRGSKYKVYKIDQDDKPIGEALGTHDSQEQAAAQARAIYASEGRRKKEDGGPEGLPLPAAQGTYLAARLRLAAAAPGGETILDALAPGTGAGPGDNEKEYYDTPLPVMLGLPCSFAEMDEMEAAGEMQEKMMDMTGKFKMMCDNIMMNPDIEDKGAAITGLAKEYADRMNAMKPEEEKARPGLLQRAKEAIFGKPKAEEAPGLFIWKEGDSYRWLAAYSNNRRDDDDPPEIISSESHKEFDRALEHKEWPMPEAWLWHVPFPVGITQYHAYDESTGFPVAAGVFYSGMDWAAEGLLKDGWTGVSHGMPTTEIHRDASDPTIITRHRTREISFLPTWAAANKLAFNIITKESDMSNEKGLPAHKREAFEKAFGAERVAEIEAALEDKAKEADEAGIEKKDLSPGPGTVPGEAEAQPETPTAPVEEQQVVTTPEVTEQPLPASGTYLVTREEVVETLAAALGPVHELVEEIKALKAEIDQLKAAKVETDKEKAEATPAYSLLAMLKAQSVIGLPETRVKANEKLTKDGPEEAQEEALSPVPIFNTIMKANRRYAEKTGRNY